VGGRQEVDFEDEEFARLSLAAVPQMTPELARIVSIFHLPWKPDARCGRLPIAEIVGERTTLEPQEFAANVPHDSRVHYGL